MNAILNNPYRICGILAGASAKEKLKQTNRLKKYLAAGQTPPDNNFSFPVLGKLVRTPESVNEAESKLNLDADMKELQLIFRRTAWAEIEKSGNVSVSQCMDTLKGIHPSKNGEQRS